MSLSHYQKYGKKHYNANKLETRTKRQAKKQYKEKKLIMCQICNENVGVKGISIHLSKLHNVAFIDYMKQHISDFFQYGWQWCDNCGKEPARNFASSKKKFATCSKQCMIECRSKIWLENGHPSLGRKHTDESKIKCSIAQQRRMDAGLHPFLGKQLSKEHKLKISNSQKYRAQQLDYINPMQGKTHTPESIAKICKDRVGSSLEVLGKELLNAAGYKYTHQFFIVQNGRCYSYDFKLTGLPIVIELDGDYWHGGPGVKKHFFDVERIKKVDAEKELAAKERGYKVIRVWESELRLQPEILVERISESHNIG